MANCAVDLDLKLLIKLSLLELSVNVQCENVDCKDNYDGKHDVLESDERSSVIEHITIVNFMKHFEHIISLAHIWLL